MTFHICFARALACTCSPLLVLCILGARRPILSRTKHRASCVTPLQRIFRQGRLRVAVTHSGCLPLHCTCYPPLPAAVLSWQTCALTVVKLPLRILRQRQRHSLYACTSVHKLIDDHVARFASQSDSRSPLRTAAGKCCCCGQGTSVHTTEHTSGSNLTSSP